MDGFKAARDFLLAHRTDYAAACRDFRWPEPTHFNWALDWFDAELARGDGAGRPALTIVGDGANLAQFRRALRTLEPARQCAARARRQTRRPRAADARQCRAAVGDDAGGDEARRRDHPGRDIADAGRSRRPVRARAGAPCRDLGRRHREVRRLQAGTDADRGGGRAAGLASLRRPPERARRVHSRRGNQCRRSAAALLHVGNDGEAQAGAAFAPLLSDRSPLDDVRDRSPARRRPPQRRIAGLGQACLELFLRPLECRRDGVRVQPAAVRRQGAARDDIGQSGDVVLRAPDGVAHAGPGRPEIGASTACANSSPPENRSTPRSSRRSMPPGA